MPAPNQGPRSRILHRADGRRVPIKRGPSGRVAIMCAILIALVAFGLADCGGNATIAGDPVAAGASINASQLAASPSRVSFGTVTLGASATQVVTLSNTGQSAVNLSGASVTGPGFTISNLALPMTLAPGANTSFYAKFTPPGAGNSSGSISVTSNASNSPLTVSLSAGGATAQLIDSPSSLNFGNVAFGSTSSLQLKLTNGGATTVTISKIAISGTGFTLTPEQLPLSLSADQAITLTVIFAPVSIPGASAASSGSLSIWVVGSNSPLSVPLSGSGVAATGKLTANPASLSFGSVTVGSNSVLPVVVTNSGSVSVTITQASTTGLGFSVTASSMPITLAAGQGASLSVTFGPSSAGGVSGNLSITSNASNSPTVTTLSATGVVQHSVSLSWLASTSPGVAGYNVYRGTVSGGPYSKLTTAPVSGTSYTDSTVQSGQTYYYVTTAVNSQGIESSDSNQATAVIPSS